MSIESDLVAAQGQESDSPPGDSGQSADETQLSLTDQILQAADPKEEPAPSEDAAKVEKVEKEPDKEPEKTPEKEPEKPKPYDQDEKWLSARAAEKTFNDILEKHDLDAESLEAALESGSTLKELLGARDLNKLTKDADELARVKAFWAEQDEEKLKEEEEPDETIGRRDETIKLKDKEIQELKDSHAREKAADKEANETKGNLKNYTNVAEKSVESVGLKGEDAEMAKEFLGIGNPFNEIDITDSKAVKESNKLSAEKFAKYLADRDQRAIDNYAKGKSDIIPISKTDAPVADPPSKESKVETPEEANKSAKSLIMELYNSSKG